MLLFYIYFIISDNLIQVVVYRPGAEKSHHTTELMWAVYWGKRGDAESNSGDKSRGERERHGRDVPFITECSACTLGVAIAAGGKSGDMSFSKWFEHRRCSNY